MKKLVKSLNDHDGPLLNETLFKDKEILTISTNILFKDLPTPFNEIFYYYFESMKYLQEKNYPKAYQNFNTFYTKFHIYFQGSETQWVIPVFKKVILKFRKISEATNHQDSLITCARLMINTYGSLNDKESDFYESKKQLLLTLINNLFKLSFKLNNLELSSNIVKQFEMQRNKIFNNYPIGQRVTYNYYSGVISLFGSQYEDSQKQLKFAFEHCNKKYKKNKRLILEYLLCVNLFLRKYPKDSLLQKYNLLEYQKLIIAIKKGDILTFDKELEKNQLKWVEKGNYLLLDSIRNIVYLNLFRKIYVMRDKNSRFNLKVVLPSLNNIGIKMEIEELECIIASLIYQGYIQGYISHEKKILVLSKEKPFPK